MFFLIFSIITYCPHKSMSNVDNKNHYHRNITKKEDSQNAISFIIALMLVLPT